MLIASVVAALVLVIAAGVTAFLLLRPGAGTTTPPEDTLTAATDVKIQVRDDRVTLTWTDTSDGKAQPIIVGNREGEGQRRFAVPPKGATEAPIAGLNKNFDYCFIVVLAYSADDVRQSDQVCTNRQKASPPPPR